MQEAQFLTIFIKPKSIEQFGAFSCLLSWIMVDVTAAIIPRRIEHLHHIIDDRLALIFREL